jgi:hypothetical protein
MAPVRRFSEQPIHSMCLSQVLGLDYFCVSSWISEINGLDGRILDRLGGAVLAG